MSTKQLTNAFGWDHRQAFQQHDVQELSRVLTDRLHEIIDGKQIQNIFAGTIRTTIRCTGVDFSSSRDEDFWDLNLDVRGLSDLQSSLRRVCAAELMNGSNQYDAGGEYGKQDAEKCACNTPVH